MIRTSLGAAALALITLGSVTGCAIGTPVTEPTWRVGTPDAGTRPSADASVPLVEPTGPAHGPTINEGTWVVGKDVEAGTYQVKDPTTELCFYTIEDEGGLIYDAGSGPGKPQMKVRAGDVVMTMNCGIWVMQ